MSGRDDSGLGRMAQHFEHMPPTRVGEPLLWLRDAALVLIGAAVGAAVVLAVGWWLS